MAFDLIVLDGQIVTDRKTGQPRVMLFEAGLAANSEIDNANHRSEKYGPEHDLDFLSFLAETLQAQFPGKTIDHNKKHFGHLNYLDNHVFFDTFRNQSYDSEHVVWHTDPLLLSQILSSYSHAKPVTLLSCEGTVAASTMSKAVFGYHLQRTRPDVMPQTLFIHPDEVENSKACIDKICGAFNEHFVIIKPSISSNSNDILVVNVHPDELNIALDFYKQRALKTDTTGLVVQAYVNSFTIKDSQVYRGKIRWILAVDDHEARLLGAYRNEVKSSCRDTQTFYGYLKNIEAIKARTEAMISLPHSQYITALSNDELDTMKPLIEPITFQLLSTCRQRSLESLLVDAYDCQKLLVVSDICRHLLSFAYRPAMYETLITLAQDTRTRLDVFGYLKGSILNKAVFLSKDWYHNDLIELMHIFVTTDPFWKDLLDEPLRALLNQVLQESLTNPDFDISPYKARLQKLRDLIKECASVKSPNPVNCVS